ncbi:MAG TPA: glycosyltransferase family 39 protein [Steroidobacteraceae bacterium]|nr:glycosyltransferase family 39 protein [Steroidobacteraceae bacterium]
MDARRDRWHLLLLGLILIGVGLGLRGPWPADEPRFALVARDMVDSGNWLFPRIGGDLYGDKPPLFFWLIALCYRLCGSLQLAFLLPPLAAALGVLALVHDLARRLWNDAAAWLAALTLLFTLQFIAVMRGAQIDTVLCFLTTLSLYGLLRHLLLGPSWGWYFVGALAAGLGVIAKGVGFLPLLVLLPYGLMRGRWPGFPRIAGGWRWFALAAAGVLLPIALWLVPMLLAVHASGAPDLVAYRNEILFRQTVTRYTRAWHHVEPWYFFFVSVIPALWLPWTPLLFGLVPRWRAAWRAREPRTWLPLAWVLLVLLFFAVSTGKRGVYIFPALPALAIGAAPFLPELYAQRWVRICGWIGGALLALACVVAAAAWSLGTPALQALVAENNLQGAAPLWLLAAIAVLVVAFAARRWPLLAWPGVLLAMAVVYALWLMPRMDAERTGRAFIARLERAVPADRSLGLLAYKEQFLLYLARPATNFGHARSNAGEGEQETWDAARWLNEDPRRILLVPAARLKPCFAASPGYVLSESAGQDWSLVSAPADAACAARGELHRFQYPVATTASR